MIKNGVYLQDTFSARFTDVVEMAGDPISEGFETRGKGEYESVEAEWACRCAFTQTDRGGGGVWFACEEHAMKATARSYTGLRWKRDRRGQLMWI
jgi:hypothetical protein